MGARVIPKSGSKEGSTFIYDVLTRKPDDMPTEDPDILLGHCDNVGLTISVRGGMAHGTEQEVLLHEILHAAYNAAGAPFDRARTKDMDGGEVEELSSEHAYA